MKEKKRSKVKRSAYKEVLTSGSRSEPVTTKISSVEISPVQATDAARSFCELIKTNVQRLSDAECHLLLQIVNSGREIRVMAKAASRIWGEEFDGGTAEIVGPTLYRQLLRRMNCFDEFYRPAPSVERIGQISGYEVDFIKPDFVYRVQGNGLNRTFAPRYMPVAGMDIEDVMYVIDIISEHEAQ